MATAKTVKSKSKAKAKKAVVQVEVVEQPSNKDIKINVAITMQDGSVHEKEMANEHPAGCIMKSDLNNPNMVFDMFKLGLISIYGSGHIRG